MTELRYNPLLRTWTLSAPHRLDRPYSQGRSIDKPCPFCPGSGQVPDQYDVLVYDNDFPVLTRHPPAPDHAGTDLYPVQEAYGKCEIILYSPDHHLDLARLPLSRVWQVVNVWTERFEILAQESRCQYILIFENHGESVGMTVAHPHAQIYALPYVPLKIKTELASCQDYYESHHRCLLCDMNREEQNFGGRMIYESTHYLCYIPFFSDSPYGAFIVSKQHYSNLLDLSNTERKDLARAIKLLTAGMNRLFNEEFPYMMVFHQSPGATNSPFYHFHIEFYSPTVFQNKQKYPAAAETGAWAAITPVAVEAAAVRLRQAVASAENDLDVDN